MNGAVEYWRRTRLHPGGKDPGIMFDMSTQRWTTTAFCILMAATGCNTDHPKPASGDAGQDVRAPDMGAGDSSAELRADGVRSQDADAGADADTGSNVAIDAQQRDMRVQDGPSTDAPAWDALGEIRPQDLPTADAPLPDASGLDSTEAFSSDGTPTVQDLQGAWHSPWTSADPKAAAHRRFRFQGNSYAFVYDTQTSYCAETGRFTLTAAGQVQFYPSTTLGVGGCASGPDRVASIAWAGSGVVLSDDTGPIPYLPTRAVPKIFATVEKHDGNFADDATLPGNNAMAKADALCNASIAKPDEGPYRALLIDGSNRTALPAHDWVLKANTTYFQADGVLNVFTTNASAVVGPDANRSVVGSYGGDDVWSDLGCDFSGRLSCQGWTSNQEESGNSGPVGGIVAPASTSIFACNVSVTCAYPCGLLCVSVVPDSTGANPDGGTGTNEPAGNLQGAWVSKPSITGAQETRRLVFEDIRYTLVKEFDGRFSQPSRYCSEVGTFEATTAGVHFRPERVVGYGSCIIGDDRVEALSLSDTGMSLSDQGTMSAYVHAPDVSKLFVTVEGHNGDFADDQTLPSGSVMDKADAFCQKSAARPDGQRYKAVLVDGILRSLSPTVNSPFKPNTTYYDAWGASQVIETDAAGALSNRLDARLVSYPLYSWAGFNSDLKKSDSCKGWTSASMQDIGAIGEPSNVPPLSYSLGGECGVWEHALVCASQ